MTMPLQVEQDAPASASLLKLHWWGDRQSTGIDCSFACLGIITGPIATSSAKTSTEQLQMASPLPASSTSQPHALHSLEVHTLPRMACPRSCPGYPPGCRCRPKRHRPGRRPASRRRSRSSCTRRARRGQVTGRCWVSGNRLMRRMAVCCWLAGRSLPTGCASIRHTASGWE